MKKNFLYWALLTVIVSCGPQGNKPEIIENTFAPEQSVLYSECAELKGISDFIIGETTFKQAIRSKIYSDSYDLLLHNNFYNGYWGIAKNGGKYEKATWIEKNASSLKQLPCPSTSIKIGQLEFDSFDLAFYNDKLAAIFFKSDDEELHDHYVEKYGDGRGSYYYYHLDNEPCEDRDKLESLTTTKEERIWENEDIKLEYFLDSHFEMSPNIETRYKNDSWYLLSSKSLYPLFLEELNRLKTEYDKQEKNQEQETLNQF